MRQLYLFSVILILVIHLTGCNVNSNDKNQAASSLTETDSTPVPFNERGGADWSIKSEPLFSINFRPNMPGVVRFCKYLNREGYHGDILLHRWNKKPFDDRLKLSVSIRKLERLADMAGYKGDLWGVGERITETVPIPIDEDSL